MAEFESRRAFEHIDKLAYEIGPRLAGTRGDKMAAEYIRKQFEGYGLKVKVQDAYSMRSTPQVIGALRDGLAYVRRQVEIELNGAGDNPLFLPDDDLVLTGAKESDAAYITGNAPCRLAEVIGQLLALPAGRSERLLADLPGVLANLARGLACTGSQTPPTSPFLGCADAAGPEARAEEGKAVIYA